MTGRAIIVHDLDHAVGALRAAGELGVAVTLRSAPGAAAYLGAAVFRDIIKAAQAAHPGVAVTAVLDCADNPGLALNALREGVLAVRLEAPGDLKARVADIAAQLDGTLDEDDRAALDLMDADDAYAACRAWLAPDDG